MTDLTTAEKETVETIVLKFLSVRFSQPPGSFPNDLDLGAAFSMNEAAFRAMISELTRQVGASFKLSEAETVKFSDQVQTLLPASNSLTVGTLIKLVHRSLLPSLTVSEGGVGVGTH